MPLPRTTRRPFFPGAEPSPRRPYLSESSDDDSHQFASRPTTSEGQTTVLTTAPGGGADLSSSFQSWGFASLRSLSFFSDDEDDETPRYKPRTSTASLGES